MTRICITGHNGFVGRRLAHLLDKKSNVEWKGASRTNGFDLTDTNSLEPLGPCDVIINLAGRVGVGNSWDEPADYFRVNLLSTLNVMEHARRHNARVIHVSSYLYGIPEYQPIDEQHPVSGHNPYSASKLESERICMHYSESFSIPTTILRPFNLFGFGQINTFLVPLVISQALEGGPIRVHTLTPRRDYLWIDDLAEAIALVADEQRDGFSIFNIGSGVSHSTGEVIDMVLKMTGPCQVLSDETPRVNELDECICDNSRFRSEYGWEPKVNMEDGLSRLIAEFKNK